MENNFLPHFIKETVYVIEQEQSASKPPSDSVEKEPKKEVTPEVQTPLKEKVTVTFKGSNHAKVLIVVDYNAEEFILDQDEAFLSKILQAVKVSISETAILNLVTNTSFDYDELLAFDAERVLYFGANKILPDIFKNYVLQTVSNKQVLLSPTLSAISSSTDEKKLLWEALKKMF